MDAVGLVLEQHANTHAAAMAKSPASLEDLVVSGLTDDQIRHRPQAGQNSIGWLIWHMARCEDVLNLVLSNQPQVIDDPDWPKRLNLSRRDIGTGMTDDEVSDFGAKVDVQTVRAYRAAVGRRTREIAQNLRPDEWDSVVDASRLRSAVSAGAFGDNAGWVEGWWSGQTQGFLLSWLAVGHNYLHLGEAQCVRSQAGVPVGL